MARDRAAEEPADWSVPVEDQDQLVKDIRWLAPELAEDWIKAYVGGLSVRDFLTIQAATLCMIVDRGASSPGNLTKSDHRAAVLDALVRLNSGFGFRGTEPEITPSAGGAHSEAFLIWAQVRRRQLDAMTESEIATECRAVLAAKQISDESRQVWTDMHERATSSKMSATARARYHYGQALIAAGQHLWQNEIKPGKAARHLEREPYRLPDKSTVQYDRVNHRIVVRDGDGIEIGSVSADEFRKTYMNRSFLAATAGRKSLPDATAGGKNQD